MISYSRLVEVLRYEPETGKFFWIKKTHPRSNKKIGDEAGCYDSTNRYVLICVDKKIYHAHRLAWLFQTQRWPIEVDHKDTDGWNNRWDNLREATRQQNCRNTNPTKGRHLPKGVSIDRRRSKKYFARINIDGKQHHLGSFYTAEEASMAYKTAVDKHFGSFGRY